MGGLPAKGSLPKRNYVIETGPQDLDFLDRQPVEGQLLAERLAFGALSSEEALQYAVEIGAALNKAHARGMVHGCLAPCHICLTANGAVVLAPPLHPGADTAPYRAPEQVRGDQPDSRSDVFAFGAILYEMAAGTARLSWRRPAAEPVDHKRPQPDADPAIAGIRRDCERDFGVPGKVARQAAAADSERGHRAAIRRQGARAGRDSAAARAGAAALPRPMALRSRPKPSRRRCPNRRRKPNRSSLPAGSSSFTNPASQSRGFERPCRRSAGARCSGPTANCH